MDQGLLLGPKGQTDIDEGYSLLQELGKARKAGYFSSVLNF